MKPVRNRKAAFVAAVIGTFFLAGSAEQAEARGGSRSVTRGGGGFSSIHQMMRKSHFRPRVSFVQPHNGMQTREPVITVVMGYLVQVGWVSELELYVNGKKVATYPIEGRQRKGGIEIKLDLGPYGPGTHSLRVAGIQGTPGRQTIKGRRLWATKVTLLR